MTNTNAEFRKVNAEEYLAERTGSYEYRCQRYEAVADELFAHGMNDGHLLIDVGAGMCDFDVYLRSRGWKGRYLPVDASIQGADLTRWSPACRADYMVAIEVLEHLHDPEALLREMCPNTNHAVVITTPYTDMLGHKAVRDMDRTHVRPIFAVDLLDWGFGYQARSFFGQPNDSLLGVWVR